MLFILQANKLDTEKLLAPKVTCLRKSKANIFLERPRGLLASSVTKHYFEQNCLKIHQRGCDILMKFKFFCTVHNVIRATIFDSSKIAMEIV